MVRTANCSRLALAVDAGSLVPSRWTTIRPVGHTRYPSPRRPRSSADVGPSSPGALRDRTGRGLCRDVRGLGESQAPRQGGQRRGHDRRHRRGGGVRRRRRQGRSHHGSRRTQGRRRRHRGGRRRPDPGRRRLDRRRHHAVAEAGAAGRDRAPDRGRVSRPAPGRGEDRTGGQGRVRSAHRRPAGLLPAVPGRQPRGGSVVAGRTGGRVPHHRIRRGRPEPRRVAPGPDRRGAAGQGRRGPEDDRRRGGAHRASGVGAGIRRVRGPRRRHPGTAARLRDELVARVGAGRRGQAGRRDHGEGPARGRRREEDLAGSEAAHAGPVDEGPRDLRGGPDAGRARHARGGLRRLRRTRTGDRSAGPRLHIRADGTTGEPGPPR